MPIQNVLEYIGCRFEFTNNRIISLKMSSAMKSSMVHQVSTSVTVVLVVQTCEITALQ